MARRKSAKQTGARKNAGQTKGGWKGNRRRWLLFAGLLVLVVLLPGTAIGVSVQLENTDSFCASCHTQPETTYVDAAQAARSQKDTATDLATFHAGAEQSVHCIECHSGKGITGRVDAITLGARDLTAYVKGNFPQPSPLTHPIADVNCTKCHADYAASNTFDNHYHVFLARWRSFAPDKAATCVDCHGSHIQDGQADISFLSEPQVTAQCNACHRVMGE